MSPLTVSTIFDPRAYNRQVRVPSIRSKKVECECTVVIFEFVVETAVSQVRCSNVVSAQGHSTQAANTGTTVLTERRPHANV